MLMVEIPNRSSDGVGGAKTDEKDCTNTSTYYGKALPGFFWGLACFLLPLVWEVLGGL